MPIIDKGKTIISRNPEITAYEIAVANGFVGTEAQWLTSLSAAIPYKIYTALLSQSGTDDPDVIVLQNTLSGAIVWTRDFGKYIGTLNGEFTLDKTFMLASFAQSGNDAITLRVAQIGVNDISLWGTNATNAIVDLDILDGPVNLEIRVYP